MEAFFETISVINNPELQNGIGVIRWVFGISGICLLLFCLFVIMRSAWLKFAILFDLAEFFTFRPYGLYRMTRKWQKIEQRLESANEAEYKLAIIEADGLLNEVLLRMNFKGETLEDKLKTLTTSIISNLDDVSMAHRVRNDVVHDPDYRLSLDETKKTLSSYEIALKSLDLI